MIKCISLLSGGLDSILATRLMMDQGLDVLALTLNNDVHPRMSRDAESSARRAARRLGVPLIELYEPERFVAMLKNPAHGYGRNMNPCIDCRIFLLRLAAAQMTQTGAKFVVTGEVLGERPMSQRRGTMLMIEREARLERLVVRPLSAKHLEPTIPEEMGWISREKTLDIEGRSRKPQMALAARLGIAEYPSPAGGCLLTDPGFSERLRRLMRRNPGFTAADLRLLRVGRHFHLDPLPESAWGPIGAGIVVGRNDEENQAILEMAQPADVLLDAVNIAGPTTLLRGAVNDATLAAAARVTARFGKGRDLAEVQVFAHRADGLAQWNLSAAPADDAFLALASQGSDA